MNGFTKLPKLALLCLANLFILFIFDFNPAEAQSESAANPSESAGNPTKPAANPTKLRATQSDDSLRPRYGFFGYYDINLHTADFRALPNVPSCCPKFETGNGAGFSFGLIYEFPIGYDILLGAKLGFFSANGLLSAIEEEFVSVNLKEFPGRFEHSLDAKLSNIALQPTISYRILPNLFTHLGMRVGIVAEKQYEQREEIIDPQNAVFVDTKSPIRNNNSGDLDAELIDLSATFGIGYELPLNKSNTLSLAPEIFFRLGLSDVAKEVSWKYNSINLGLALRYSPYESIKISEEHYKIDTVRSERPNISREIVIKGLETTNVSEFDIADTIKTITELIRTDTLLIPIIKDIVKLDTPVTIQPTKIALNAALRVLDSTDRSEIQSVAIKVELRKEVYPLLPFIFFELNSASLNDRYERIADNNKFDPNSLNPSPVIYNRNILNIIGIRMSQEDPNASITLTGYIDQTTEDDCKIAKERAEIVKKYLVDNFKIKASRIKVSAPSTNCFPPDMTKTQSEMGYSENRRVEISADNEAILSPITGRNYMLPTAISPENIILSPSESSGEITEWRAILKSRTKTFLDEAGNENLAEVNHTLKDRELRYVEEGTPMIAELILKDKYGTTERAESPIMLRRDTADYQVESITLTLFQVSQANLNTRIKNEIKKFVENLDDRDEITVKGYCDILGDPVDNLNLSKIRAEAVADYIKSIARDVDITAIAGVGAKEFPPGVESFSTPEERFICRTVQIEIRKKIKR